MTELKGAVCLGAVTGMDFAVLDFIQNNMRCGFMDGLMRFVTVLGNGGIIWIALGLVLCCFRKYRACGVSIIIGLLAGLLLSTWGIKNIVCRLRPYVQEPDITLLIPPPGGYSFPSGHALSSFTAAFLLIMHRVKYLDVAALVLACLIAFSRLYLYVHFPTDVLCGIALAAVIAAAVFYLEKRYLKKKMSDRRP